MVDVVEGKMQLLTDESAQLIQTMGSSISNLVKEMSRNVEKAIVKVEGRVRGMTEDVNRHLGAMENNVTNLLGKLKAYVDNVAEVIQKDILLEAIFLTKNVNKAVKRTLTLMDVGIFILALLVLFVSRYLRLTTKSDIFSSSGYFILGFFEWATLTFVVHKFVLIFHNHVTDEDIEKNISRQLAVGIGCFIALMIVIIIAVKLIVISVTHFTVPQLTNENNDRNANGKIRQQTTKKKLHPRKPLNRRL
jgi:hypothetical protein